MYSEDNMGKIFADENGCFSDIKQYLSPYSTAL